ncbi:MAG: hypothetical protein B6240_01980 [Desulfobacteraceae bacterium 4572_87]|nr:MAG: hypothetical protein B6240_01980 [Desulfobacteraceae bacterium 4572_87]
MPKPKGPYQKHIYWLTRDRVTQLKAGLLHRNIQLKQAKGIVCTPLDVINKITCVAPEIWDDTCGRQGSWYRTSNKNGLYLIISAFELDDFEIEKSAVITESDFVLPAPASPVVKQRLFEDARLKERMPARWQQVEEMEKRIYLRWAKRLGSSVEDYDQLYLTHTANHANFIVPRFYVETSEDGMIPYSIDRSAHLCSCCVELFQVLGGEFKKKLVAPCPGATIFARLKPDRYLMVAGCRGQGAENQHVLANSC